jgi:hypothetical protein
MLSETKFVCGQSREVLNEENLHTLYGVDIKLLPYEHNGKMHEALVPVLPDA